MHDLLPSTELPHSQGRARPHLHRVGEAPPSRLLKKSFQRLLALSSRGGTRRPAPKKRGFSGSPPHAALACSLGRVFINTLALAVTPCRIDINGDANP